MNIKIAMPEVLVIFSIFMYSQSFWFSVIAFCLGLLARIFSYVLEFHEKQAQTQSIKEGADEVANALKGIFNSNE